MTKTVLGIFDDRGNVEDAIRDLESAGYQAKDISIVMKDTNEAKDIADNTGANVTGGAVTGATTGAVIGGLAGLLVGIGAIAIPGIGALLVAGPLAAALGLTGAAATTVSGAATGAVAGGLIGALMGLGLPREDAQHYEERVKEGAILVAVPAQAGRTDEVQSILDDNDATDIRTVGIAATDDKFERVRDFDNPDYTRGNYTDDAGYMPMGAKGGQSTYTDEEYADEEVVDEPTTDTETHTHHTSGSKGGSSGRGWHGDSEHHAEAARGEDVHSRRRSHRRRSS